MQHTNPALIYWSAPDTLELLRIKLLRQTYEGIALQGQMPIEGVDSFSFKQLEVIFTPWVGPHVDRGFAEWGALFILQGDGQKFVAAFDQQWIECNLHSKHMLIFNHHRTHRLEPLVVEPRYLPQQLLIAAALQYNQLPSQSQVEADFLHYYQQQHQK